MYGGRKKPAPTQPESDAPKDALASLMEGGTPDKDALRFPSERPDYQETSGYKDRGDHKSSGSGRFEEYRGDHSYDYKPRSARGEYGGPQQQEQEPGAFNSVKSGATRGGVYVKDKTMAGASYLREKDWTREKEFAGKAGTATKTGAVYVGSGMAKGAGWLWKSGKNGVDNLRGTKPPPAQ